MMLKEKRNALKKTCTLNANAVKNFFDDKENQKKNALKKKGDCFIL